MWRDSTCNGDGDDGGGDDDDDDDDDDNDDDDDDDGEGEEHVVATAFVSWRYMRAILRMSLGNSNHDKNDIQWIRIKSNTSITVN